MSTGSNVVRQRLTITGVVQGVGFRPFVYGLAVRYGLAGFVGNNSGGVFVEIEGDAAQLDSFHHALSAELPPLAHLESITTADLPPTGGTTFTIVHSQSAAAAHTLISPDICICNDCLHELFDPANRRFRYPFINCTHCGPRFTIIKDIPYDRPLTTMADFPLCPACQAEYDNPLDRRFHAQPNACPVCGPQVWLEENGQWSMANGQLPILTPQSEIRNPKSEIGDGALRTARALLAAGKIVAVKGLGGFHLACDATNDAALYSLREKKGRVDKPFAVMAGDVTAVHTIAHLSPDEEALLTSKERPIVLLRKKAGSPLSDLVAPGNNFVGVMLPYTPLHYLLLEPGREWLMVNGQWSMVNGQSPISNLQSPILVMTSGNYSDEPIVQDNDEARERLAGLADAFLFHNRAIHARCDDSVMRIAEWRVASGEWRARSEETSANPKSEIRNPKFLPLRRSRGYAPFPVKLPFAPPMTLAVGGELKSTFCLTKENFAFMSQHIGDMENLETLQAFDTAVTHFQSIFRAQPERIVCDLHPGYLSTRWAQEHHGDLPLLKVQHHHAHIAAVMAEHRLDGREPVIGFSFDGTGYGPDGAIWGGEVLVADYDGFERVSHLQYVPLVGGDAAVKRPLRVALAHLWAAGLEWDTALPPVAACPPVEQGIVARQLQTGFNNVPTSSMGRLFDAVAALVGMRQTVTYEAQGAIELEALVDEGENGRYAFILTPDTYDAAPVIREIVADVQNRVSQAIIAAKFHNGVADLIRDLSLLQRERTGLNTVALSGGVFQNVTLLHKTITLLRAANFTVLSHALVPPNDGGLALGQAVIRARV